MAIQTIAGEQAWPSGGGEAAHRRWPTRKQAERLHPIAQARVTTPLRIAEGERIFCIGSCFAMELSRALHRLGYPVLSLFRDLPVGESWKVPHDALFNKYNVGSIFNELRWALEPGADNSPDEALIDVGDGLAQDYQLAGPKLTAPVEVALNTRRSFSRLFAQIKEADVVVITLGLAEAWFDNATGLYLNAAVPREVIARYPGRFEVRVMDCTEITTQLQAIHALLCKHLKPTFRLLLTVSPVPMTVTFRNQDVLAANAYSKAVLRAAAETFVQAQAHLDAVAYFPSYELATLSHPDAVWGEKDLRHVDASFAEYIMAQVMHQLAGAPAHTVEVARAKALYRAGYAKAARRVLRPLMAVPWRADGSAVALWAALKFDARGEHGARVVSHVDALRTYKGKQVWRGLREWLSQRKRERRAKRVYHGFVERINGSRLTGWAIGAVGDGPLPVEVRLDGQPIARTVADRPRPDVQTAHPGHLYCGFQIDLPADFADHSQLEVLVGEEQEPLRCTADALKRGG